MGLPCAKIRRKWDFSSLNHYLPPPPSLTGERGRSEPTWGEAINPCKLLRQAPAASVASFSLAYPSLRQWLEESVHSRRLPGPGRKGLALIIIRRWVFHRIKLGEGFILQGVSSLWRIPRLSHVSPRLGLRNQSPGLGQRFFPADADFANALPTWATTKVETKNWGWASSFFY